MIMCKAVDEEAEVRSIEFHIDEEVFVGGKIVEFSGSYWLENVDRIPTRSLRIK